MAKTGTWGIERVNSLSGFNAARFRTTNMDTFFREDNISSGGHSNATVTQYVKYKTLRDAGSACLTQLYSRSNNEDNNEAPVVPNQTSFSMKKTIDLRYRSADAPIAVGRSGKRKEKGTSTSGLIGERLQLSEEANVNSLVQRSWMYANDPALKYKIHGLPEAYIPTDMSLKLREQEDDFHVEADKPEWGWNHARRSNITAGPTSRCLGNGIRIFMDD